MINAVLFFLVVSMMAPPPPLPPADPADAVRMGPIPGAEIPAATARRVARCYPPDPGAAAGMILVAFAVDAGGQVVPGTVATLGAAPASDAARARFNAARRAILDCARDGYPVAGSASAGGADSRVILRFDAAGVSLP
ncbi:hypothetical protein DXV76_03750 [Rhodobacteraceae bacterium CCMM004]|nr:hypothetical protein DXV76_03750 [Rhodobacteraceae bacterium CCMM004]